MHEEHLLCKPEQFLVASCLLEALSTLQPTVGKQRPKGQIDWSPEEAIFASNFELVFPISVQCARGTLTVQAGAIRGGLMFTRSVTNASTTVRKQRPLK